MKRKLAKKEEDAKDELLEALAKDAQDGFRCKRKYTIGLVDLVARIGSCPSAAEARSPLSGVIPRMEAFIGCRITQLCHPIGFSECLCYHIFSLKAIG